jgi:hypothetical protein|tara:strand:+ start:6473 stop:6583 length:111 start_codon:yes stop_codon:yes gene_type:complete
MVGDAVGALVGTLVGEAVGLDVVTVNDDIATVLRFT